MAPSERSILLSQNQPCLIPGYTGHCPTLKFRVGKRYGANTNEIIKEYRDKGVSIRHEPYRQGDAYKQALTPIQRKEGQTEDFSIEMKHRSRPYILGYTGSTISPDFPPIAGYTGHIPRLRVTDASLSQRYNIAARQGLAMLQKEKERRQAGICSANDALRSALSRSEDRYTTPAM